MTHAQKLLAPEVGRWAASAVLVVGVHCAVAWGLLRQVGPPADAAPVGALTLELAPIAVARADVPPEIAPGPDQVQAAASPEQPKAVEEKPIE